MSFPPEVSAVELMGNGSLQGDRTACGPQRQYHDRLVTTRKCRAKMRVLVKRVLREHGYWRATNA